ncbi:hypothetical protein SBA3_910070 [Candidatus Sulfopaludibacter sp. SbA3]|nr:hypothetical protein SBA3_910070 [Candidatus Sulfopaludibacter sp. SbA3]
MPGSSLPLREILTRFPTIFIRAGEASPHEPTVNVLYEPYYAQRAAWDYGIPSPTFDGPESDAPILNWRDAKPLPTLRCRRASSGAHPRRLRRCHRRAHRRRAAPELQ